MPPSGRLDISHIVGNAILSGMPSTNGQYEVGTSLPRDDGLVVEVVDPTEMMQSSHRKLYYCNGCNRLFNMGSIFVHCGNGKHPRICPGIKRDARYTQLADGDWSFKRDGDGDGADSGGGAEAVDAAEGGEGQARADEAAATAGGRGGRGGLGSRGGRGAAATAAAGTAADGGGTKRKTPPRKRKSQLDLLMDSGGEKPAGRRRAKAGTAKGLGHAQV